MSIVPSFWFALKSAFSFPQKRCWHRLPARRRRRHSRLRMECLESRELLSMAVGMNLENIKDYSPAWTFTDAFQSSRTWVSESENLTTGAVTQDATIAVSVDAHGWPLQLQQWTNAQGQPMQQELATDMFGGLNGHYAAGVYTAWWDGTGTVRWSGDVTVIQTGLTEDGHHFAKLNAMPGNAGIQMTIASMSSTDPLHNVHVWMPDYNGQSFVGQVWQPGATFSPFHPLFLQRLAPFHTLRFMQWQETDSSQIQHWSDRRHVADARQGTYATDFQNGAAPEYEIELANELNSDIWVNMPHMADDGYVQNFATLVRDTLKPGLKVYVEWSNEVWNSSPGYNASPWVTQQMQKPENAGLTFYQVWAKYTKNDFDIWSSVFAGQTNRMVRVVAGQSANSWITSQVLQNMGGAFDAIAIAPYMSMRPNQLAGFSASTTANQVIDSLTNVSLPNCLLGVNSHKALSDQYSAALGRHISLLTYEGGVELMGRNQPYQQAFLDAGVSPSMYDLYHTYLNELSAHGVELFLNYNFTSRGGSSPYGDFGALHAQDQAIADAPKYYALVDFIGVPTPGPTPTPTTGPYVPPPPPHGSGIIAVGTDAGVPAEVKVYDAATATLKFDFFPYGHDFSGGVRVAVGDVTGDGVPDIVTAPGPGGGPHIKVFDGISGQQLTSAIGNFYAYTSAFRGGVWIAVGDINKDGFGDVITGADAGGGPHVRVFSGRDGSVLLDFFAYDPTFLGGVRVAAGDVEGTGTADIITGAGAGGGAHVKVFRSNGSLASSTLAYDPGYTGGVCVAAADVLGTGRAQVITAAGAGGGPHVQVLDGATLALRDSFFAYDSTFRGGVRVGTTTMGGRARIVTTAGPGGGSHVEVIEALTHQDLESFFAGDSQIRSGLFVAGV